MSQSQKNIKKLNKKSKKGKLTKLMKEYINHHNNLLWKANRKSSINLKDWHNTLYSPSANQTNINNLPEKIVLSKRKIMRHGSVKEDFYVHKLTEKDKRIAASKLIQINEHKNTYKSRKIIIKKQILDNILFTDLGGTTHSLGEYYKDHKSIPNKISNYTIKEIVKQIFDIEKSKKIELNIPHNNFNIDFKAEKKHAKKLFKLRNNKLKLSFFILV
jgi:hypothetical protein